MEDERIIALFWRRDEGAISQASRKYGAYCRSIAMHILGDSESCEECVNDTWLRAWNAIPPARPAVLRAFLGRITRNLSLSMLRGRTRAKRGGGQALLALDELEDCVPDLQTPEKVLEDREIAQSINRWLGGLPAEQRAAFIRRYWYFDDLAALALRMGWSPGKTNSCLRRLRVSLRQHLESEGIAL